MKTINYTLLLSLLAFTFFSCKEEKKSLNKFSNPDILNIYELADHRNATALLPYLDSPKDSIRVEAVRCMASVQDPVTLDKLHLLLMNDLSIEVRELAAYAIGQIGDASSVNPLVASYSNDSIESVRGNALESLGKIGAANFKSSPQNTEAVVKFLESTRFHSDSEREGWAKGALRLHMAGITNPALMNRMAFVLQLTNRDARIACAHAMARFKGDAWFQEASNIKYIKNWCRMERDFEVKIPQMALLGRLNDQESLELLKGYLGESQNDMVIVAALRAAQKRTDVKAEDLIPVLQYANEHVVLECIAALQSKIKQSNTSLDLNQFQKRSSAIQASIMRLLSTKQPALASQVMASMDSANFEYSKVHFAKALGAFPNEAQNILNKALEEKNYAIKYTLTEAYLEATSQLEGAAWFEATEKLFQTNDIGVQALIAAAWREKSPQGAIQARLVESMQDRLKSLKLPDETETYNELVNTLNAWTGEKQNLYVPAFNHPIDWALVASLPKKVEVEVFTTQGDFVLELETEFAPGSVASFVKLAQDGFFQDKFFHRVVPNFVIQGGCPRGDGMGSTDYTIRSEFALHQYGPGALGLASSGKDTESCQWFVTNTFTPHLEGRYSIFGHVIKGMENVNSIQVGDRIQKVIVKGLDS